MSKETSKMHKHVLAFSTSAFILVCGAIGASAQGSMMQQGQTAQQQEEHHRDWGRGMGMMGRRAMMGYGSMHSGVMMRMLFAMMDSDGDGTVSLQEFQTAHERIFKAMDANKDGVLTLEEIQSFLQGTRTSPPGR
jgi:hypothetical protein